MTWDDAVVVPVAALPAMSRSVVAGVKEKAPDTVVDDSAVQVPAQAPVTVNVTVLFPLLSTSEPAYVTVRVLPELVR